jgi:hypothetical protein
MKAIRNITPVAVLLVAITTMLAAGKPLPARLATLAPSVALPMRDLALSLVSKGLWPPGIGHNSKQTGS